MKKFLVSIFLIAAVGMGASAQNEQGGNQRPQRKLRANHILDFRSTVHRAAHRRHQHYPAANSKEIKNRFEQD